MDRNSPAEELPALYRAILDRVAELDAGGERTLARRLRSAATQSYSRAWDERARRELERLLRRSARPTAAERLLGRGAASGVRLLHRRPRPAAIPER